MGQLATQAITAAVQGPVTAAQAVVDAAQAAVDTAEADDSTGSTETAELAEELTKAGQALATAQASAQKAANALALDHPMLSLLETTSFYFEGIYNATFERTLTGICLVSAATELTAITTPTSDSTPDVVIYVNEPGRIAVSGVATDNDPHGCGLVSGAVVTTGSNTVTLSTSGASDKAYTCTITFTNSASNVASALILTKFILDTTAEAAKESTAVTTPTSDTTPDLVIYVAEAGTIAVGGTTGCGLSSGSSVTEGSNTITLSTSGNKAYTCTITFTDIVGNVASALILTPFTLL